jgi:hypothetical protein
MELNDDRAKWTASDTAAVTYPRTIGRVFEGELIPPPPGRPIFLNVD